MKHHRRYTSPLRDNLLNPIIRTFSRKRMHLSAKPGGKSMPVHADVRLSWRGPVQRLWCLIIMLIEASVFTRGERESFFEGPVKVGEVIEA